MRNKIYTYQFSYDENVDGFGTVQFCAETINEARKLFLDFCKENNLNVIYYRIDRVYNPADAAEYGDRYGAFD